MHFQIFLLTHSNPIWLSASNSRFAWIEMVDIWDRLKHADHLYEVVGPVGDIEHCKHQREEIAREHINTLRPAFKICIWPWPWTFCLTRGLDQSDVSIRVTGSVSANDVRSSHLSPGTPHRSRSLGVHGVSGLAWLRDSELPADPGLLSVTQSW